MAATLQQLPTCFLVNALYTNPNAATFSWNIAGQSTPVTRSQVVTELSNRSGQGDVTQVASALPVVNTKSGATSVTDKSQLK